MQQFWNQISTTMLGCGLKIAVENLADSYIQAQGYTRASLLAELAKNGKKPEVLIMMCGITSNQHHDTAGVQDFFKRHFYPWLWANSRGLEGNGSKMYCRSDGCRCQFKSARHFRFISGFPSYDWARTMMCLWTHFESCHGKDISDPECGRFKWLLSRYELRGNMIKDSKTAYTFLLDHQETTKSFAEKRCTGIFRRVFFYTDHKDIRPLHSLAQCETLKGTVTDECHLFASTKIPWRIEHRAVACLNCAGCKNGDFDETKCEKAEFCGPVGQQQVFMSSGARTYHNATRSGMSADGLRKAQALRVGQTVAAECAKDTEPYILFKCLEPVTTVTDADYDDPALSLLYKHNWMGEVQAGDPVVKGLKLIRGSGGLYRETDKIFWLFAEDTRGTVKAKVVAQRQGRSQGAAAQTRIYQIDPDCIQAVEKLVYVPDSQYLPRRPAVPLPDPDPDPGPDAAAPAGPGQ